MGGCFPCFGSSNKEDNSAVKEVAAKKESFKAASLPQSHHPTRVSSDKSKSRSVSDSKKETQVPKDGPTAHISILLHKPLHSESLQLLHRILDKSVYQVKEVLDVFTKVASRAQDK